MRATRVQSLLLIAALSVVGMPSSSFADPAGEETPAQRYARHSVTILGSPELSVPLTATARFLVDGVVRVNFAGGFVVQPRVGAGVGFSALASGAELIARPGIGIGYAIPIRHSIALTPTVGYDLFVLTSVESGSVLFIQRAALDLPVSIVLDSALIEPYLLAGVSIFEGQPDVALAIGIRIGLTLPLGHRSTVRPTPPIQIAPVGPSPAPSAASNAPSSSGQPTGPSGSPAPDSSAH